MDDSKNEVAGIYARESPYLARYVQIGVASDRIISVSFPREAEDSVSDHPLLDRVSAYLEGKRDDFSDIDVGLTVPTPNRAILVATREIPYGTQVNVERLARTVPDLSSDEEGHETVRTALADNPAPLVIPDHRVRDAPSAAPPKIEQRLRSLEGL